MCNQCEIIIVGYRWYWQTLERTIESIVSTNKGKWRINVGVNSPEAEMLSMVEKYKKHLNLIEISNRNLNKVGMQRRLVHLSLAKYLVSFDHDSYVIDPDWQAYLIDRIEMHENKTFRFFGDFGGQREQMSLQMTNNTVGILGKIYFDWLDEPKRQILKQCPWYDPANKVNHETLTPTNGKDQIWFCAGAFYVFLREPYIRFDYPGFDYKMMHEDMILSYFFQHHGYRLGDLVSGFIDSGLNSGASQTVLGDRLILTDAPRTFDMGTVETCEHSVGSRPPLQSYSNKFLKDGKRVRQNSNTNVLRQFDATHTGWRGSVVLLSDGTFRGGFYNPDGRWKLDGDTLSLAWYHWPETKLKRVCDGFYFSTNSSDPLLLREMNPGPTNV